MEATATTSPWNLIQKILFRFFAVYFIINIFLEIVQVGFVFDPVINWVAHHVLGIAYHYDAGPNGSGDTTHDYLQELVFTALSFITCVVWSIADRKRSSYNKFYYWINVLLRYFLAYTLLDYAYAKIFGGQFSAPDLNRLMQPYGKSSPMGLAWTFLGFSKGFIWFMAISEGMGGLLMLFRRTTLFGACIATTVIANIVAINFCFDVPVKLFSGNLLLMSLFILSGYYNRFLSFFILNKPVPALDISPVFKNKKMKIARIVIKVIVVLIIIGGPISDVISEGTDNDDIKPPLYGIYNVQAFVRNNDTLPPLATDSIRWNKMIISYPGYAAIQAMNENTKWFIIKPDTLHHTITAYTKKDSVNKYKLSYKTEDSTFYLYGKLKGDSIWVKFKRTDESKYLLMNRGFHWVNEYPFNR